jgi:hypothetical protein
MAPGKRTDAARGAVEEGEGGGGRQPAQKSEQAKRDFRDQPVIDLLQRARGADRRPAGQVWCR